MHPLTEMLRDMLAKGVDHEAILMAVEGSVRSIESAQAQRDNSVTRNATERDEKRRKTDAARQKRWRDNNVTLRDNNVTQRDECTAALVPQVKNLSSFSKVSKKERKKEESLEVLVSERNVTQQRDKRGCRLPENWMPDDPDFGNEFLGAQRAAIELDKFHNYWRSLPGSRGLKLNWQLTWRNWVLKASESLPRNGVAKPLTYFQQRQQETRDVLQQLTDTAERLRRSDADAELFSLDPVDQSTGLRDRDGSTVFQLSGRPDRQSH